MDVISIVVIILYQFNNLLTEYEYTSCVSL